MPIPPATEKEKACIEHLKKAFPAADWLSAGDEAFLDGHAYLRFARARDGHTGKASEMLKAALEWRRAYKPFAVTAEEVAEVMGELTMTCGGRCKAKRPLLVMTLAVPNKCKAEDRVRQLVYILEDTQRKGYDCITWIIDFGEMGKHPKDDQSKITRKETMQILQDYYPERLGLMLLYRTPWYIRWSIGLVKPFLNARTSKKIFVVGQKIPDLAGYCAADQIPTRMGGTFVSEGLEALAVLAEFNPKRDTIAHKKEAAAKDNSKADDFVSATDAASDAKPARAEESTSGTDTVKA